MQQTYPVLSDTRIRRGSGYTLLELLVVLALAGLLLSAFPLLNSTLMPNIQFLEAKTQLLNDVRRLKSLAQSTGRSHALIMNAVQDGYQIGKDGQIRHFEKYQLEIEGSLRFFPNGSGDFARITLTRDHYKATIEVDGVTGAILKAEGYEGRGI